MAKKSEDGSFRVKLPAYKSKTFISSVIAIFVALTALLLCLTLVLHFELARHQPRKYGAGAVIQSNFPDPSVIKVHGRWYAFAGTHGTQPDPHPPRSNIQMATSDDFSSWTVHNGYDALPALGNWTGKPGNVWAPDVNERPDGSFIMYYSAITRINPGRHCIGAAVASDIVGPYMALDEAIACDLEAGGNIDPNLFQELSKMSYLIYKVDGNAIGRGGSCSNNVKPKAPTPLKLQEIGSPSMIERKGPAPSVLDLTDEDGPNIEGPALFKRGEIYYLLFSSGCYSDETYMIRYVSCVNPRRGLSGCDWASLERSQQERILVRTGDTRARVHAPGSADISSDGGKIVFHGDLNAEWFKGGAEHGSRVRGMYAADLVFKGEGVLELGELY